MNVIVFGAGSVGAHHTFAARENNLSVTLIDPDGAALERFQKDIYPNRYGAFDSNITLCNSIEDVELDTISDSIWVIGSPPDTHGTLLELSLKFTLKAILIEKPISGPDDEHFKRTLLKSMARPTKHFVGYNLLVADSVRHVSRVIKDKKLGDLIHVSVEINESWSGILNAHPWLASAQSSYLGYTSRGGGALYEHSHGVSLAVYFMGLEEKEEKAELEHSHMIMQDSYDCFSTVALSNGKIQAHVVQDVLSFPTRKQIRLQFTEGQIILTLNHVGNNDHVQIFNKEDMIEEKEFPKSRKDDFSVSWKEILNVLSDQSTENIRSPIDIHHAIKVSSILDQVSSLLHIKES